VLGVGDREQLMLRARIMIGKRREAIVGSKNIGRTTGEYLKRLLDASEPEWMTSEMLQDLKQHAMDPLIKELGATEFFIYPVVVRGRHIGIVYADRYAHQTPLTSENLQSFCHLAEHAALAFKILSK